LRKALAGPAVAQIVNKAYEEIEDERLQTSSQLLRALPRLLKDDRKVLYDASEALVVRMSSLGLMIKRKEIAWNRNGMMKMRTRLFD
jgi:hypothetical protein